MSLDVDLDSSEAGPADEDTMRILVATDMHVGYAINDPIRCEDGYNTLEELLKLSYKLKCDMILLGGDLFHENKPPREVEHKVIQLLRKYCFNDNPVSLEFLSDSSLNFEHSVFTSVNYEERNINVGMPIFTIHGNHDDLSGRNLTALDPLHEAGLLNLFGKQTDVERMSVMPILLQKGQTKLALYGLGSQRDDRLYRMFLEHKIDFPRDSEDVDSWFNLMVLHQNRAKRSETRSTGNYIPERVLPPFMDLVVWGHEHQCLIEPVKSDCGVLEAGAQPSSIWISQPGSTIATSLSPEEAGDKKVALLKINGRRFDLEPITLQTVRQFYFEEIVLNDEDIRAPIKAERTGSRKMADETLVTERLENLLTKAAEERRPGQPRLPLIRIRVIYSGQWENVEPIYAQRFGNAYVGRVANPKDLLLVKVKKAKVFRTTGQLNTEQLDAASRQQAQTTVEDIVKEYFVSVDDDPREGLRVLHENVLSAAVRDYVNNDNATELDNAVNKSLSTTINKLKQHAVPKADDATTSFHDNDEDERDFVSAMISALRIMRRKKMQGRTCYQIRNIAAGEVFFTNKGKAEKREAANENEAETEDADVKSEPASERESLSEDDEDMIVER